MKKKRLTIKGLSRKARPAEEIERKKARSLSGRSGVQITREPLFLAVNNAHSLAVQVSGRKVGPRKVQRLRIVFLLFLILDRTPTKGKNDHRQGEVLKKRAAAAADYSKEASYRKA